MSNEIHVPNGTMVNGVMIESRQEMHRKIAEQALEIDALKKELTKKQEPEQPEIPDLPFGAHHIIDIKDCLFLFEKLQPIKEWHDKWCN